MKMQMLKKQSAKNMSLDGTGWFLNYFQPKHPVSEHEFNMEDIKLKTGKELGVFNVDSLRAGWIPAFVPSDIRDVLIKNDQMEDPYWGRNSHKCRWVEDFEWWYVRDVNIQLAWKQHRVFLRFEGVDYLAEYWWDGNLLGKSGDMFVPVEFELTGQAALPGKHLLAVCILPPPKSTCNHYFDGRVPIRARHHKMQCSWGWDWARPIVSMGIWDSVSLYAIEKNRILNVFVEACPIDVSSDRRILATSAKVHLMIQTDIPDETCGECLIQIFDPTGSTVFSKSCLASSNINQEIFLDEAMLWWPNGYGPQPLYKYRISLGSSDSREGTFGIRKLRMLPNDEKEEGAYDLTFEVNGVKIFVIGANWVPADLLPARLNAQRYEYLLGKARDIGFNLLRVWGGGLIEKQSFYDIADEMGLMIWQEFPLSCSNYPQDMEFLEDKRVEAVAVVKKLRNHPCICLWCGGNEMDYYGMSMEHPVLKLFKRTVEEFHPGVGFHDSSPDRTRPGERDHGPWDWREHAFWNNHFRALISEFGCNALPDLESLKKYIPAEDLWPPGESYSHHFCELSGYPQAASLNPEKLEQWIDISQHYQADQLAYVVSLARTRQFKTSGVIIWQFNSSWPEGGWGIVDYYGREKLACSILREVCRPITIAILDSPSTCSGKIVSVWIINGFPEAVSGTIYIELLNSCNKLLEYKELHVSIEGYQSSRILETALPFPPEEDCICVKVLFENTERSIQMRREYSRELIEENACVNS